MIVMLFGMTLLAGMVAGWYGHKAKLRIDVWGGNANARDLMFQAAEGHKLFDNDWTRMPDDESPMLPFGAPHMSSGAAGSK